VIGIERVLKPSEKTDGEREGDACIHQTAPINFNKLLRQEQGLNRQSYNRQSYNTLYRP